MTARRAASRTLGAGLIQLVDDFMSWLLYGYETWLVALLKGVPLFLYVYFLLTYVPNYVYYLVTQYIPFLGFSPDGRTVWVVATSWSSSSSRCGPRPRADGAGSRGR